MTPCLQMSIAAMRESLAEAHTHMSEVKDDVYNQISLDLEQIRRKQGNSEERLSQTLSILEDKMETRYDDINKEFDSYRLTQRQLQEELRHVKYKSRSPMDMSTLSALQEEGGMPAFHITVTYVHS